MAVWRTTAAPGASSPERRVESFQKTVVSVPLASFTTKLLALLSTELTVPRSDFDWAADGLSCDLDASCGRAMAVAARTKTAVRARTETFFMEASLKNLQDSLIPKRRLPPEGNAVDEFSLQTAFHRLADTRGETPGQIDADRGC